MYFCKHKSLFSSKGKKGSLAISPGQSCKDIKDSGDFDTTGSYWIRPAGSLDSFQGYCDMSAVGRTFLAKTKCIHSALIVFTVVHLVPLPLDKVFY